MAIYEDYYVINSHSYIKSVPTRLDKDFKKELIEDNGDLKPHVEKIIPFVFRDGKQIIIATLPTCFIEIEYKTSDGHYLINHEVFLYEEDYPNMEALEAYKDATSYGFASQVTEEINDLIDCHHASQGCMCLSYGDY
jgi:hypothetical protein